MTTASPIFGPPVDTRDAEAALGALSLQLAAWDQASAWADFPPDRFQEERV